MTDTEPNDRSSVGTKCSVNDAEAAKSPEIPSPTSTQNTQRISVVSNDAGRKIS